MQRYGAAGPAGEDGDEIAPGEFVANHERRGLGDAEAGHCGVDVAAAVVDREDVARVDFQRFIAALKFERDDPPGLRAKIADGIVRALQFVRSFGEAEFRYRGERHR